MVEASGLKITVRELLILGAAIVGTIWTAASWKTQTDQQQIQIQEHLNRIDEHLHNEDENIIRVNETLQWLKEHRNEEPASAEAKPKHHSIAVPPERALLLSDYQPAQDSSTAASGYVPQKEQIQ